MGLNNEHSARVVLDIETVGGRDIADLLDPVQAPSNYKDPIKIADYCAEKQREQIERAGLDADLCEVVAVGTQIEGGEIVALTRAEASEEDLLRHAWQAVGNRTILGFNILGFDLPVLIRRSQLLGVTYPALNLDRYRTTHLDLLDRLSFSGRLKARSLAFYCRRFGIPCADPHTGAEIAALVAAGEWGAVREHVRSDVDKTTALAQRLGHLILPMVPEEQEEAVL